MLGSVPLSIGALDKQCPTGLEADVSASPVSLPRSAELPLRTAVTLADSRSLDGTPAKSRVDRVGQRVTYPA